jgi:hypothetical protein
MEKIMIPNRNKVEQPSIGNFTLEHEHAQRRVVHALQTSGNTVIVAADQAGLMTYYVARMLDQLSALEGNARPKIRKLPADRDGILDALNQRLADIELANVAAATDSDKHRAREVWVYESLTTFKADGVCFGAKIIRQFKAAGISLMVSATPGETNAAALKQLMHSCKAQRWDFATPTQEQCDDAMAQAAHSADFGAVQSAIRDMGMMANLSTPTEVLDFPTTVKTEPSLDSDLDVRQLLKAQRKQNKQQQIREQAKPHRAASAPRKPFALLQLVAGITFIGIVVAVQLDMTPGLISGTETEEAVVAEAIAVSEPLETTPAPQGTEVVAAAEVVEVKEVEGAGLFVAQDQAAVALGAQTEVAEEILIAPVVKAKTLLTGAQDQELMQIFASTEPDMPVATEPKARVNAPAKVEAVTQTQPVVSSPPAKPKGVFVQHGSFARLQGALVWQSNYSNERKTKVFIKGTNPKRFVVVSGPFADRQRARDTLEMGSDAFLVPAHLVGEQVMSLGGL